VLVSPDHRVRLSDRFPAPGVPELEAVFVGAAAENPVFVAADDAVSAAAQLGFVPAAEDTSLTNLPLSFASAASFAAAFPDDDGWLARTVRDYFNAGGLRAWVVRVRVDPATPIDAYMAARPPIVAAAPPTGVEIAMQVTSAGLLLLPDLEYLCVATVLPSPTIPAPPPVPVGFRPVTDFVTLAPSALPASPVAVSVSPRDVLGRVSAALAKSRRDMLCLFALPVGADQAQSVPDLIKRAETYLHGSAVPSEDLPQVQAFAPLTRDTDGAIASPSGMIAGFLGASAQTNGVWRSIAGRSLPLGMTPLRRIESNALRKLRRSGIATLRFGPGGTAIDDDILACTDVPANATRRPAGTRRLIGWLLRNLQRFGEQLVFENVLDDGRVELVLTDLFSALLQRGALNGNQVTDAVTITRRKTSDAGLIFDIAVDIASALETIQLRFLDGALSTTLVAA
jgi:hypothetical protein